jgi:hypothetical protein
MGYQVETVRYDKWRAQKDFFGLWDLICVGKHDIIFVQVKTNNKPDKDWRIRAESWGPKNNASIVKEYVVYRDYQRGVVPSSRVTFCGKSY